MPLSFKPRPVTFCTFIMILISKRCPMLGSHTSKQSVHENLFFTAVTEVYCSGKKTVVLE